MPGRAVALQANVYCYGARMTTAQRDEMRKPTQMMLQRLQ